MYELKGKGFPLGALACQRAIAFLLESRLRDKPSIRPQSAQHVPEGGERSRMINVPLVWSVSLQQHTPRREQGPNVHVASHKKRMDLSGR